MARPSLSAPKYLSGIPRRYFDESMPPTRVVFGVALCVGLLAGVFLSEMRQYVAFRLTPGREVVHCMDLHDGALF